MTPIDLILAGAVSVFSCVSPGVHDGDGWRCADGTKVRAFGIDAPELGTTYGAAATRAMADIIAGQTLLCERRGKSWDRTVALCRTPDGQDVSAAMMRTGLALDCPAFSKGV